MHDDDHLIDAIKDNEISKKKESARIQPEYSGNAIVGAVDAGARHTREPIIGFIGIILSIVRLGISLSFYLRLNHVSYNIDKRAKDCNHSRNYYNK